MYCPIADNERMDAPVSGAALPRAPQRLRPARYVQRYGGGVADELGLIAAASPPGSARQAIE